jgi:hypothetical protein
MALHALAFDFDLLDDGHPVTTVSGGGLPSAPTGASIDAAPAAPAAGAPLALNQEVTDIPFSFEVSVDDLLALCTAPTTTTTTTGATASPKRIRRAKTAALAKTKRSDGDDDDDNMHSERARAVARRARRPTGIGRRPRGKTFAPANPADIATFNSYFCAIKTDLSQGKPLVENDATKQEFNSGRWSFFDTWGKPTLVSRIDALFPELPAELKRERSPHPIYASFRDHAECLHGRVKDRMRQERNRNKLAYIEAIHCNSENASAYSDLAATLAEGQTITLRDGRTMTKEDLLAASRELDGSEPS